MAKHSPSARFKYWFDKQMAKGLISLVTLLGLATLGLIFLAALVVMVFGITPTPYDGTDKAPHFFELMWGALMHAIDGGTVVGDADLAYRIPMFAVTIGGLIIVASLISIISGAFDARVEELRKGRSKVLEENHTLILGWNSKVFTIVNEICIANESQKKPVIVIMANRDKVEMEDELAEKVDRKNTTLIVRTGDPMSLVDLEITHHHEARSVVILAPEDAEDQDSFTIKTALALVNNPSRKEGNYHIVGEIKDAKNLEAACLVGGNESHWILADDLISRITVQACRQSGLSHVLQDLLDFGGDEIYMFDHPELAGKTYGELQFHFADSAVIGISADHKSSINPKPKTVLKAGEKLIVVAKDDSAIKFGQPGAPDLKAVSGVKPAKPTPESTLILGYNESLNMILSELATYMPEGSTVKVVADVEPPKLPVFKGMKVTFKQGDSTSRPVLNDLNVSYYDHIIVVAYSDHFSAETADGKTLVTLLHLRDMSRILGRDLNVISEMIDDRNRQLAEVTSADDFIVSDKLVSLMLAQLEENEDLYEVFEELLSSEGSEVHLYPAELYVKPGTEADFYTVLAAAQKRGETAFGYRIEAKAKNREAQYGVVLNPVKTEKLSFAPGDKIVVMSVE